MTKAILFKPELAHYQAMQDSLNALAGANIDKESNRPSSRYREEGLLEDFYCNFSYGVWNAHC